MLDVIMTRTLPLKKKEKYLRGGVVTKELLNMAYGDCSFGWIYQEGTTF
jgi:hypothetical protein